MKKIRYSRKELEDLLEHQKAIASAKEKVLLSYISEIEELYKELHKKNSDNKRKRRNNKPDKKKFLHKMKECLHWELWQHHWLMK